MPANAKLMTARSLYAVSTTQNADTVEAHPTLPGLFALGTYQVEKDQTVDSAGATLEAPPITRSGMLRLMQADFDEDGRCDVTTLSVFETAAILDMKWLDTRRSLLSVALATSELSLYHLDLGQKVLKEDFSVQLNDSGALCLSLDWSDRTAGIPACNTSGSNQPTIVPAAIVSQSDGTLTHIPDIEALRTDVEANGFCQLAGQSTWKAHDYEAWIAAFDCWSGGSVVWSGGDDLTLKGWDLRTPCSEDGERFSTFAHKRSFEGGVTAMQSHHLRQHVWAVGSYDNHVRLFDARNPLRPLASVDVGGGVWRTKWHPTEADKLLVACMHDGFKVIQIDAEVTEAEVVSRFDDHESLAYGCDWDRGRCMQGQSPPHVFSCSFYDSRLHVWACDV